MSREVGHFGYTYKTNKREQWTTSSQLTTKIPFPWRWADPQGFCKKLLQMLLLHIITLPLSFRLEIWLSLLHPDDPSVFVRDNPERPYLAGSADMQSSPHKCRDILRSVSSGMGYIRFSWGYRWAVSCQLPSPTRFESTSNVSACSILLSRLQYWVIHHLIPGCSKHHRGSIPPLSWITHESIPCQPWKPRRW